ncbi:MAG: hypothetical protein U0840_23025 [Gemmataceae bacterium]
MAWNGINGRRWALQLGLPLLAAAGMFTGLFYSGKYLGNRIRERAEPGLAFTSVECEPPPGMTAAEFLTETQYLAELPDWLDALQPETPARIASALALHPWVEKVQQVRLLPHNRARVDLVYRTPTLVVKKFDRVVNGRGILLPKWSRPNPLPVLTTEVQPPGVAPGKEWKDVRVQAAASLVAFLQPRLASLGLEQAEVSSDKGVLTLATPKARLVWGLPPGHEGPEEARSDVKALRLPETGPLDGFEWDVRARAVLRKKPLTP